MDLAVVHHPAYVAPLPDHHRFPIGKFAALKEALITAGLVAEADLIEPGPVPRAWLALAHHVDYVDAVLGGAADPEISRRIGLPLTEAIVARARHSTGGTVLAARLALGRGLALNTAGGSHHAGQRYGAGFCTFNDVAVAARVLLAEGGVRRVLIVDLDVHQGDGSADIFRDDARVFTFSMHAEKNFPTRKIPGALDVSLPDALDDQGYLDRLDEVLGGLLDRAMPDLVFYNAGVDPHADDRLGRLALTDRGLAARDAMVLGHMTKKGVPVACVIGGGYGADVAALGRRHAIVFEVAAAL